MVNRFENVPHGRYKICIVGAYGTFVLGEEQTVRVWGKRVRVDVRECWGSAEVPVTPGEIERAGRIWENGAKANGLREECRLKIKYWRT